MSNKTNLKDIQEALFPAEERNEHSRKEYEAIMVKIKNGRENTNNIENPQHNDHN